MPQGVTPKSVTTQQDDIDREHNCPNTNSKSIWKPERFPNVVGQNQNKNEREIEKITMHVLHDEWKGTFAPIMLARFPDGACRRVGPKRFVVRAPIVIAGDPKSPWRPKDKECGRENEPAWPPIRFRPKPAVGRIAENFRGIKW